MDPNSPVNGKLFDSRYRLDRRIGSGGMADVYLAVDESLGRQVAIKILSDRYAQDDGFVERFRREASAAASLNHPNIVAVYDRGEAEGTYYIAMEYLDGPTLKQEITHRAPLPEAEAIAWATQALDALDFAHRRGVIHRDVKPHNMVLTNDGRLKVTDFGIARAQNTQEMTEVGSIVGTAQYLSPEQARGQPVGPQSDLYSMGIVLFEMLTGELPFTGDGAVDIAMKQVSEQPPSLRSKNRLVSPDLEQVVMRSLAKDPALRHSSARAMADELRRVSRGGAVSSDTQQATQVISAQQAAATNIMGPRQPMQPQPPPKRSIWPWLLVVLLLAVAAAIGVVVYKQLQSDQVKVPGGLAGAGTTCATASAKLKAAHLTPHCQKAPSNGIPEGQVIKTSPGAQASVDKNSTVTVSVSGGPNSEQIPTDLAGKSADDARSELTDLGFQTFNTVTVNSPAQDKGNVVSTSPSAGKTVSVNTPITLSVASGSVIVPDLSSSLDYNQAQQKLAAVTLNATRVDASSSTVPVGHLISTSPGGGSLAQQNSTVTVTISSGPGQATVPSVVNLTEDQARNSITANGFRPGRIQVNTCDQTKDGIVTSQNPTPGTQLQQGKTVYYNVSVYNLNNSCTSNPPTT